MSTAEPTTGSTDVSARAYAVDSTSRRSVEDFAASSRPGSPKRASMSGEVVPVTARDRPGALPASDGRPAGPDEDDEDHEQFGDQQARGAQDQLGADVDGLGPQTAAASRGRMQDSDADRDRRIDQRRHDRDPDQVVDVRT